MTPTAPRFYARMGVLFMDRRPIELEDAQRLIFDWWSLARRYQQVGDFHRSAEVRRQADALQAAKHEAQRQYQASGPNPSKEAYERRLTQEEVAHRFSESVEEGERA